MTYGVDFETYYRKAMEIGLDSLDTAWKDLPRLSAMKRLKT